MGTDHDGRISQARLSFQAETPSGGSRSMAMSLLLISSSMTLTTSKPINTSTAANPSSPRRAKAEASFEPGSFCMALDIALVGRTSRIRRRRAQDVADTTDSLRAVACIRFVRPWLVVWFGHGVVVVRSDVAGCETSSTECPSKSLTTALRPQGESRGAETTVAPASVTSPTRESTSSTTNPTLAAVVGGCPSANG